MTVIPTQDTDQATRLKDFLEVRHFAPATENNSVLVQVNESNFNRSTNRLTAALIDFFRKESGETDTSKHV